MKKIITFVFILFYSSLAFAQSNSAWIRIGENKSSVLEKAESHLGSKKELFFQLNEASLRQSLNSIGGKTSKKEVTQISIPNLEGVLEVFSVWESSNFEPALQEKFPEIRAYAGIGVTDPKASLHFSLSPDGIQTMVLRADSASEFIEPSVNDKKVYVLFNSKNRDNGILPFSCKTEDVAINKQLLNVTNKTSANNKVFKTLRLALSCTGEYGAYHGGTVSGALAAMSATMARVNGVFNKDLAVKLILVDNTNIIYTDATTDPYSDATKGQEVMADCVSGDCPGTWSNELQTTLTSLIGETNYDIGHLFGASGGGGNAGCIGCVCEPLKNTSSNPVYQVGKGGGYTSPSDNKPEGDTFDIDFVAHEFGHQLGANHTFSYSLEGTGVNIEPGSGSTIMGYAGITDYNVQNNSDDYFAYRSILQIQNNLLTKSCPQSFSLTNNPPVVNAGLDWTIPNGTAFILTGSGSDPDGDTVSYCWEQNDNTLSQSGASSVAFPTKPSGPLFRSLRPSSTPVRFMPSLSNVLSNKLTTTWESVSSIARTLHFTLTARDNAGPGTAQTNTAAMIVNVSGTVGPFSVTSQNTDNISWFQGESKTITWSVNGANALTGSANVNIKLSTDGGLTFPITLKANTLNDGSENIVVPAIAAAKNCRILIEPVGNIYYAVNSKSFAIGYSVSSSCNTYAFSGSIPFSIPDGVVAYTTRTFTFPSSTATVSNVSLGVGFNHSWPSDVQIELMNPQSSVVRLFDRDCGSNSTDLLLNYDDSGNVLDCASTIAQTVSPSQPLAVFNGLNPQGTWVLRVRDVDVGKTGILKSASLKICTQTFTLSAPDFKVNDFVMYPNPNNGDFNIQFTSISSAKIKVLVHDMLGRKLFDKEYENKGNIDQNIQLKNVQAGVYLLTVIDGERAEVKKMVIH